MIKKFDEFYNVSEINDSSGSVRDGNSKEIDANEDLSLRAPGYELNVSTEIDPGHELYPTISVYFPDLFMYIDLEKIDARDYDKISTPTAVKIGEIIQNLDEALDEELATCLKNMQEKVKKAANDIQSLTEVTSKRFGL
jgi:hypothetical protein